MPSNANSLRDKPINMDFEESEAEDNIKAEQLGLYDGLFGCHKGPHPIMKVETQASQQDE